MKGKRGCDIIEVRAFPRIKEKEGGTTILFYLSAVEGEKNKDKVAHIYTKFFPYMCYKAGEVLGENEQDIKDAAHSAMLSIIEHIDEIDVTDAIRLKLYCGVVAKNKAIDMKRLKDNQTVELTEDIATDDAADYPEEVAVTGDDYEIIIHAIRSLDEKYREVFTLRYLHHYKEKEIAEILNIPENTVSTRIARGKQILRELLGKEGVNV